MNDVAQRPPMRIPMSNPPCPFCGTEGLDVDHIKTGTILHCRNGCQGVFEFPAFPHEVREMWWDNLKTNDQVRKENPKAFPAIPSSLWILKKNRPAIEMGLVTDDPNRKKAAREAWHELCKAIVRESIVDRMK